MNPDEPQLLSIVAPCHNEAAGLHALHRAVMAVVDAHGWHAELVLVDDGSTDRTLEVMRELTAADRRVRVISFSRNFGKEAAMLAGLREARGEAVVLMDSDLQHPPELLPALRAAHDSGADQVVARRTRHGDTRRRTLAARTYYRLVNHFVDVTLVDGAGDFRLLSRRAVDAVLSLPEYNRFSKGLFAWIGFDTQVVEYDNLARESGESSWSFGQLVNYGVQGLVSFNDRPLRAAVYAGTFFAALASGYLVWVVVRALAYGIEAPGYVTLLAAVVGLGGVQLVFLGVIGEYIGKIYYETKRRPAYLVAERHGQ